MIDTAMQRVSAVMFSCLERWVTAKAVFNPQDIPSDWRILPVKDIVSLVNTKQKVEPDKEYKMAGVRWYGEGVFHRETVLGQNLSAAYVTPCIKDALIYNRLFAWKESFAVVTEEFTDCFVSNEFPQFILNSSKILPRYLYLFFNIKAAIETVKKYSIGSSAVSRNRFKEEVFLETLIPLPPIPNQKDLIKYWEKGQNEISDLSEKLKNIQCDSEFFMAEMLGITSLSNNVVQRYFGLTWDKVARWDIVFAKYSTNLFLSSKYPTTKLRDIILPLNQTNRRITPAKFPNKEFNYIGMENVESITSRIVGFSPCKGREIKSSSVVFDDEHILYGKLRPYLRKVVTPDRQGIKEGIASSEFIAIKPNQSVNRLFLAEYLRSAIIAEQAKMAIGARMPRVSTDMLLDYMIPLPSLKIQQEIVDKLEGFRKQSESAIQEIEKIKVTYKHELELILLGKKKIQEF